MSRKFARIIQEIRRSALIEAGDIVVTGVSGGADSVLLLRALATLREQEDLDVYAVHVHHGIRGAEADKDVEFVKALCEKLEVPCHIDYVDVPALARKERLTVEEAGRKARYECLYRELNRVGGNKLAVAHHRDDSAETILFNLIRGSGIKGLCGITPVQGKLIRPLLNVRRAEIEEALAECGYIWRIDSTNSDVRYSRNRIRQELIPWLEREMNGDTVEHLTNMAKTLREINAHMEREAEDWLEANAKPGRLSVKELMKADTALQGYLIRRRLGELGGLKDITREHVEAVRGLLEKNGSKIICLPSGRRVSREYEDLLFFIESDSENAQMLPITVSWSEISWEKFGKIQFDPYTKCFDYDKIKGKLCLRARKNGDSLVVFSDGRSQSVKDYMINARIPSRLRDRIPLLVCGDEVLWVVGYRASEKFRVTDNTQRLLLVTAESGEDKEQEIR